MPPINRADGVAGRPIASPRASSGLKMRIEPVREISGGASNVICNGVSTHASVEPLAGESVTGLIAPLVRTVDAKISAKKLKRRLSFMAINFTREQVTGFPSTFREHSAFEIENSAQRFRCQK